VPLATRHDALREELRKLAIATIGKAPDIELLFVTSLREEGELVDVGLHGVDNAAQSYTRSQADEIIRSLQELGVTVRAFLSEADFIRFALELDTDPSERLRIAYTTAEGGTGPGRRALVPSVCDLVGLPILQSPAHASVLARHKFHAHAVLQRAGLRSPKTWVFDRGAWGPGGRPALGEKVIIKPVWESMCIGVDDASVVTVSSGIDRTMIERADWLRQPLVAQEFISGAEIGVPVLRLAEPRALPPVAFLRADGQPFDDRPKTFRDEVLEHDTSVATYACSDDQAESLGAAATCAFEALDMAGAGRIDFRVDRDGRAWIFDTNEAPPPLRGTSWALAAELLGLSFTEMLAVWLGAALAARGLL
jgi:D-alanine-D-alanine ligase